MNELKNKNWIPTIVVIVVVSLIGYYLLTTSDRRDPGEKIGDAINELHNGADSAARQLKSRTPADKLQDAVQDKK